MPDIERLFNVIKPIVMRVRRSDSAVKRGAKAPMWTNRPITRDTLLKHLNGGPAIGACPIEQGESTTRIAVIDVDDHDGELGWDSVKVKVAAICEELERRGYAPVAFRSAGGKGAHIYILWSEPQDAHSVRQELKGVLAELDLHDGSGGISRMQAEIFPKQDSVPADGKGNMFILPFTRKSRMLDAAYEPIELEDTAPFDVRLARPVPVREKREIRVTDPDNPAITLDGQELEDLLKFIYNETDEVMGKRSLSYDDWRNVIFAIHDATDGSDEGLRLAMDWSAQSEKHVAGFLESRVWPYASSQRNKRITIGTLFHMARANGYKHYNELQGAEDLAAFDEEETGEPHKRGRFTPWSVEELITRPVSRWLMNNVIPEHSLVLTYGESMSGKSFLSLDRAMALAQGIPWFKQKTPRPLNVVYIVAEGGGGFRNRVKCYVEQKRLGANVPFFTIDAAPDLRSPKDIRELVEEIRQLMKDRKLGSIDYIVFDTLAQCTPGANENSAEDMGLALNRVEVLKKVFKCTVELIHHAGKDETKGARGWSGLFAAADVVLKHTILSETLREMRVIKQKDGEAGFTVTYTLEAKPVDVLEDGTVIGSCIVVPRERNASDAVPLIKRLKGELPNLIYRTACSMADLNEGVIGVEQLIDNVVEATAYDPKNGKRDRRREMTTRGINALVESGAFEWLGQNRVRLAGLTL